MTPNPVDRATNEPVVVEVSIRRNTGPQLSCCTSVDGGHPGGPLLVLVNGHWAGDASCADHLGGVVADALARADVNLAPRREEAE